MNYHDDEEDQRFIDALGCTFVRTETRTTRFERKCEGCPQVIRPGETYIRTFAILDGEASVFIECSTACRWEG